MFREHFTFSSIIFTIKLWTKVVSYDSCYINWHIMSRSIPGLLICHNSVFCGSPVEITHLGIYLISGLPYYTLKVDVLWNTLCSCGNLSVCLSVFLFACVCICPEFASRIDHRNCLSFYMKFQNWLKWFLFEKILFWGF